MSQWPHDDARSRAAFYGDPDRGEPGRQLVPVTPPFQMYYDGKPIAHVMFHRKAASALSAVFNEIWEHCGKDQAKVNESGASDFCGSYNPRKIRGSSTVWSNHAYGAAIDLNAKANAMGNHHGTMPAFIVAAFDRQGFRWGGRYKGRPDWMHFEAVDAGNVAPVGFMPQADSDSDEQQDNNETYQCDVPESEPTSTPWYKKAWSWVSGGGVGALGVGGSWLSGVTPLTIVIILGFAFAVFCVVWFSKKGHGW
jgi:hypothetical protein